MASPGLTFKCARWWLIGALWSHSAWESKWQVTSDQNKNLP